MKKPIGSVFLAFVLLMVLFSGCAPAPIPIPTPIPPTLTPSTIPPTFTPVPTSTPLPLPVTISVPANAGWVRTGLILPVGQSILMTSVGIVNYIGLDPNAGNSASDGDGSSCDKATIERLINQKLTLDCLLPGVSYGALVGRVGEIGTPFLIGSKHQFTAETTGELFLGVNDCCNLSGNTGEFKVTIFAPTITSTQIGGGLGKLIFDYSSFEYRKDFPDEKGEINVFMANVDGTNLIPVTNMEGFNFLKDVSPDGTKALVVSAGDWNAKTANLYLVDLIALNSEPVKLAKGLPFVSYQFNQSAIWLDNTKLMYIGQGEKGFGIYRINADGTNQINLERSNPFEILAVTPERIYWATYVQIPYLNGHKNAFFIWFTDLDTHETGQLKYKGEAISVMYNKNAVAISPDGAKIAWVDLATPEDPQDFRDYLQIASLSDLDSALVLEAGPSQIKWRLDGKSILAFGVGIGQVSKADTRRDTYGLFEVSAESATVIRNYRLGDNILGGSPPLQCSDISRNGQLFPCLTFEAGRNAEGHTAGKLIFVNLETASYTAVSGIKFFFLTWTPRTMIWLQ